MNLTRFYKHQPERTELPDHDRHYTNFTGLRYAARSKETTTSLPVPELIYFSCLQSLGCPALSGIASQRSQSALSFFTKEPGIFPVWPLLQPGDERSSFFLDGFRECFISGLFTFRVH